MTTRSAHPAPAHARPEVVAVEGLSGSGKTSLLRALSRTLGVRIVAEAYDRRAPQPSLAFTEADELLALETALLEEDCRRYAESRRDGGSATTVVVDTDFVGPLTYVGGLSARFDPRWNVLAPLVKQARLELSRGRWGVADRYFYLVVSPQTAAARAAEALATHPQERHDRHTQVGLWEREFFLRRLPTLLPGRVETLQGEATLVAILAEVRRRLTRPARPASLADSRRVLAWFERFASRSSGRSSG